MNNTIDKYFILEVLPELRYDKELKEKLLNKLVELGIEEQRPDDLRLVEVNEIAPPLKPIKAKRLLEKWKKGKFLL